MRTKNKLKAAILVLDAYSTLVMAFIFETQGEPANHAFGNFGFDNSDNRAIYKDGGEPLRLRKNLKLFSKHNLI